MKIMDIDCGRSETQITLKDTEDKTIWRKVYEYEELHGNDLYDHFYKIIRDLKVDEVHIDTVGFGLCAFEYLNSTDVSNKIHMYKYKRYL